MEQNENTLSVLKIAPGQYPQQVEIDNNLKALGRFVMLYSCFLKRSRNHLRGFLIAA